MELLYGKPVADEILGRLKGAIFLCDEKPGLAVILVGNDPASHLYVNLKEKAAKDTGIEFFKYLLPENVNQEDVLQLIKLLNDDEEIHGIIIQLPLPEKLETEKLISAINSKKDVDGFAGNLAPVFPKAILKMIESSNEELKGKKTVVIANSEIFGKKMTNMLGEKGMDSEYFLAKDFSSNLSKIACADVVVSAVGSPGLLKGSMLKEGAIVIDGGIDKVGERVFGDVDFASTEGKDGFITPVPGGVGPVTIACLLENVYLAFEAQQR